MAEPLISDVKPLENKIPLIVEENQTPIIFQGDSEELSEEESKNIDSEIITPIVEDESEVIETETLFKGDSEEVDITEEDTPILFKGDTKEDEVSTLDKLEYGWDKNQWVAANLLYRIPRNYVESLFSEKTFEDVAIENEAERLADFEEEHYKMLDGQHDGAYTMIGEAASFLTDPYYLAGYYYGRGLLSTPLTSMSLNAALIGGATAIDSLAKTGNINWDATGKSAAIGAGIGLVFPVGGMVINKLAPNLLKGKTEQVKNFIDDKIAQKNGITTPELAKIQEIATKSSVKKITNQLDELVTSKSWTTQSKNMAALVNTARDNFLKVRTQLSKEAKDINKARKEILKPIKGLTAKAVDSKTYFREVIKPVQERAKAEGKKILDIRLKIKEAKEAWLKENTRLIERSKVRLDKYYKLEGERTAAILAELKASEGLGVKFLRAVLVNLTRPLVGGVTGAGANIGAGMMGYDVEDDILTWSFAGAALGFAQKYIQNSIKIPLGQKELFNKQIENHAVRFTFQKLRELTSATTATKLNSFGGTTQKIGRLLFRQVDDPLAEKSAIAQAESMDNYFLRKANNLIKGSNQEQQIQAVSIIRGNTELAKIASKDVLKLADDIKSFLDEFKVLYNKAGFFSPKELDNYFPRVLNWERINSDRASAEKVFTKIFKDNYKLTTDKARDAARNYLTKSEGPGHTSVINTHVWDKIVRGSPKPKGGPRTKDPLTGEYDLIHTPISDHIFKHRSLQGKFDDVEKILEREGFLINDLSLILPKIIQDSTKSIAFARVFGKGGQLLKPLLEQIRTKYDNLILRNNKLGINSTRNDAAAHEAGLVLDSIDAYFGRYQLGISQGKNFSTSIGLLTMMSNLGMLGRVTISSLGDIIQPFQNSISWTAALKGLGRTNLFKANWEKGLARNLGYDMHNEMSRSLTRTAAGLEKELALSQSWMGKWGVQWGDLKRTSFYNTLAFKGLGLEWLTGYARRFAYNTGAADGFNLSRQYYKIVNGPQGINSRAAKILQRDLEKYGIRSNQALTIGKYNTFNKAIKNETAKKFLNQAGITGSNRDALIPQVSNRLLFTQSKEPWIRALGQFLSWAQAKSGQTNRILRRIENGDVRTLIKTLAAIPIYGGIQQLREIMKHGSVITDTEYNKPELATKAWQLSGMPGWLSDLVFNRFVGPGSKSSPFFVFAPAYNVLAEFGLAATDLITGKPKQAYERLEKQLFFPEWRNWVKKMWFEDSGNIKSITTVPKISFRHGGIVHRKKYNQGDVVYGVNAEVNEIKKDLISTPHVEEKTQLPKEELVEIEAYVPLIKKYEGHGKEIYDSKGNVIAYKNYRLGDEEHITSGYGFYDKSNKENDSVTVEQAEKDLRKNIKIKLEGAKKGIKNFNNLSNNLKKHIVSSWYRGSLSGSPLTRELINAGKFEKAAQEFLNNAEYRAAVESGSGVAARMEAVAEALRNEANNTVDN
jgi:GH24 family phage-related lysozyme (muramidase)